MHVVVLGGGYAGLTLTRSLESDLPDDVEITLVDESPDHLVQHELHRVIRRPELANEIRVSLPAALERATVRVARVEEIDRDERVVALSDGSLEYDLVAICLGAQTAYYGLEGVPEYGIPLKRLSHARRIRRRALEVVRGDGDRLVVGGAGLSGVQVAGELAALVDETAGTASVTLLEQTEQVAPGFPANFQRALERTLTDADVEVRTEAAVVGADADCVRLESGERLPVDAFVWTGGICGPDAFDGDRPVVSADLRLDEHAFALGDAVRVVDADGTAVPASAQAAVREARTAAANIGRLVEAERADSDADAFEPRLESFTFDSPGWLVSVGDDAVAQVGPTVLTGRAAKTLKTTVGVGYLSSVGAVGNAVDRVSREFGSEQSD
ncbi:FAD-dependent oxidoreductase [Natronolimnohabitans sp. A-GB9]|uniref:NAD(P)/FAD-dependent oxidoreductase n=1 Tax=Natronolimnohabitans sp. A-GB9 TaxID=3069757 RepID=UPI0027AF11A0|nr:FAD-dependent oxidoreductase [Natronolimnohabitans sp. A-GB9]MDQ2051995.1 FAD-dependent oxidoreductase [Natronolimnohabitans sp. A-GB9]